MTEAQELQEAAEHRYNAVYLFDQRTGRRADMQKWKSGVDAVNVLYRGLVDVDQPDGSRVQKHLKVKNTVRVGLDDTKRLVSENQPSLRVDERGEGEEARKQSALEEAISMGYWEVADSELLVPWLTYDLAKTGACFLLSLATKDSDYPVHIRLNPQECYPEETLDGKLYDLLRVSTMPIRRATLLFPQLRELFGKKDVKEVEVIDYYAADYICQGVFAVKADGSKIGGEIVQEVENRIKRVPVAYHRLASGDDEYGGIYDEQIGEVLGAENTIIDMILLGTRKAVHQGRVYDNIANPEEDGPDAVLMPEDPTRGASVVPIPPAEFSPQLFAIAGQLREDAHSNVGYPQARGGAVDQNIISAAGIEALQGPLSSTVREIQRGLASVRVQQTAIDSLIDRKELNRTKPLAYKSGTTRTTYKPSEDIPKDGIKARVSYGIIGGLSAANGAVLVMQLVGNRLISQESGREMLPWLVDRFAEQQKIDRETAMNILLQQALAKGAADINAVIALVLAMQKGKDSVAAIEALAQAQAEAQAKAAAEAQAQAAASAGPAAPDAGEEAVALEKGQTAPAGAGLGEFQVNAPPLPFTQNIVRQ